MNFKGYCFLLIFPFLITNPVYSLTGDDSSASLSFNSILDMFVHCSVHLYNYRGLNVESKSTPVVFIRLSSLLNYTEVKCSTWDWRCIKEELHSFQSRCKANFHLTPDVKSKEILNERFFNPRGRRSYYSDEHELPDIYRRIHGRYQILVKEEDDPEEAIAWATILYRNSLLQGVPSAGFVLTKGGNRGYSTITHVSNKLEIINQFKLFGTRVQLESVKIGEATRSQLDMELRKVNDYKVNEDTPWSLHSVRGSISSYRRRKRETMDFVLSTKLSKFLREETEDVFIELGIDGKGPLTLGMAHLIKKDLENHILASLVIGENASMHKPDMDFMSGPGPSIKFDFEGSPLLSNGEREYFELITCSSKYVVYVPYTERQVLIELFSIFDNWVWFYIVVFYVGGGLFFGLIYHATGLKKKMHKKNPLTLGPFVMGLTGLVNQCVDRRINSKRFGFMVCLIIPWILIGVVISHAFRGNNIDVLRRGAGAHYKWPSFSSLKRENIEAITDEEILAKSDFRMIWDVSEVYTKVSEVSEEDTGLIAKTDPRNIAQYLTLNRSVAFASWSKTVSEVENAIGFRCTARRGGGYVDSRAWGLSRYMMTVRSPVGWLISNWVDDRIPRRMEGLIESGIADEWRRMMRFTSDAIREAWLYGNGSDVRAISMTSNISKIFLLGLALSIVFFGVWILEHIVHRLLKVLCPKHQKRGRDKLKHKMVVPDTETGGLQEEEVAAPVSPGDLLEDEITSGTPIESDLVEEEASSITHDDLPEDVAPSVAATDLQNEVEPLQAEVLTPPGTPTNLHCEITPFPVEVVKPPETPIDFPDEFFLVDEDAPEKLSLAQSDLDDGRQSVATDGLPQEDIVPPVAVE